LVTNAEYKGTLCFREEEGAPEKTINRRLYD